MGIRLIAGLGLIVLGGFIGSLIPIGNGNGAIIGCIIGVVGFCYLISRPQSSKNRFWSFSSGKNERQQLTPDISQKDIENATLAAREAHIFNEISHDPRP
jgi:hypothetical protein